MDTAKRNPTVIGLLTTSQAALELGVKPQTLRFWRLTGKGPMYVRLSDNRRGRVGYHPADVAAWVADRRFANTAQESTRALSA